MHGTVVFSVCPGVRFQKNIDKNENLKARKKEIHEVADKVFSTLGDTNRNNIEDVRAP